MKLVLLLNLISLSVFAGEYPVDDDIQELLSKAEYLQTLKGILATNRISVQVGTNRVVLSPGALRSNGLVIGISEGNPGNTLAFHLAPKPEFLEGVITSTVKKPGAGKGAAIVGSRLTYNGTTATHLHIFVAEVDRLKDVENMGWYWKTTLTVPIPSNGEFVVAEGTTHFGKPFILECNR